MSAVSTVVTGRLFRIDDTSPMDDGTGAPGNTLYKGWTVYSLSKLIMNASLWLAKLLNIKHSILERPSSDVGSFFWGLWYTPK